MLGILYGEKFEPKLPVIDGKEVEKPETTKAPNGNLVIPNPFDMEVKIQTEDYESGEITIYNTLGKLFYSTKVNSEREITIKTASWKPGIYFLFLKDARGTTHSEKIVKQ